MKLLRQLGALLDGQVAITQRLAGLEARIGHLESGLHHGLMRVEATQARQLALLEALQAALVPKPATTLTLAAGPVEEQSRD